MRLYFTKWEDYLSLKNNKSVTHKSASNKYCEPHGVKFSSEFYTKNCLFFFCQKNVRSFCSAKLSHRFIHVIHFKEVSGRFFFHFLEVFETYRIYKNILHSFQGDFKILVKRDIF